MSITKDYRYRVGVDWEGDRLTSVTSSGKPELEVATPPEFKGGLAGVWSPEDLLVASVASCFTVTLVAVLERRDLPLRDLDVTGTGHVTARDDGRFGFVAIELTATVRTDERSIEAVRHAARYAERACLVSIALDVPVHVDLVMEPAVPAPQVPAGGGGVFDVKIDKAGLYPFVSHAFAHVDLGQVGLLKVGNPPGTMSH